jgi:hypothetical protein
VIDAIPLERETTVPDLRAAWLYALIVGMLIFAHGCHGPDEDHELLVRRSAIVDLVP